MTMVYCSNKLSRLYSSS